MATRFTRREFIAAAGLTIAGTLTLSGCVRKARILPPIQYNGAEIARLQIRDPKKFKVLQFTDVHFFCAKKPVDAWRDSKTAEMLLSVTKRTKPDLIIVTGDLWHNNPNGKGNSYLEFAVAQLERLGRPWMFAWGNHDDVSDPVAANTRLEAARNSLYRGGLSDGNYAVDIVDGDGKPVWRAIALNTGEDGVGPQHHEWLAKMAAQGQCPPALAGFHIPIKQYEEAFEAPDGRGFRREKVGRERNGGDSLAALKQANVRLTMCGHDHVNDYSGTVDGVMLSYGRSSGFAGYGSEIVRKGGKLYTIDCVTGAIEWTSIAMQAEPFNPKPGERVECILN